MGSNLKQVSNHQERAGEQGPAPQQGCFHRGDWRERAEEVQGKEDGGGVHTLAYPAFVNLSLRLL